MAGWWNRIGKAIDFAVGVASTRSTTALSREQASHDDEPRGLIGGFEAKMTGVLVSALREAFNRDAARLEVERQQLEHERRRAELALQMEAARQVAERESARLRAVGTLALIVWVASLLFVTVHPLAPGAARVLLGLAWACLTGAIAAAFLGFTHVRRVAARFTIEPAGPSPDPAPAPRYAAADAAVWLAVAGFGLAAASLLVSM